MKWIALIAVLGSVLPLALWLRGNVDGTCKLFTFMGLLPFLMSAMPALDVAFISWPTWVGHTHGIELTSVDLLALVIFISLPRARHPTPFRLVFLFYFVAVLLSIFHARVPLAASFYAWQLARMYLVYAVVARACVDDRLLAALMKGMTFGLIIQAAVVLWQRYGLGVVQTQGTFVHQNTLGLVTHLVVMPQFALVLAGQRGWRSIATLVAGAIIAVLTASRATLGLSALGVGLVYLVSSARRWTMRKGLIAVAAILVAAVLAPVGMSSFEKRFTLVPLDQKYDEREAFKRAAAMIVSEHPMGVGANHYVVIAKSEGYSDRAGVIRTSWDSHVHNAYWLAAAETGYLGLVAFLLLLATPMLVALRAGWRHRGDRRGDLLLGLGTALLIVYVHSWFEWIWFSAQVQYLFVIAVGMVAGLAQQLGYWRPGRIAVQIALQRRRERPGTVRDGHGGIGPPQPAGRT